ncbi:MAG TPA: sigma factor [Planctomycetota bacterium]|nr:sigma factor [Planctomycetota bacterium]
MDGFGPERLLHEVTWLRRLARSLAADEAAADDLVGDTLATWFAHRCPLHSVRAWLATVLRHRAARQHRLAQLRARSERAAARPEATPPVDDTLATALLHRAVVDAVLALPASGEARLRIVMRGRALLQIECAQPLVSDRLQLQLRHPGEPWGEVQRFEGLAGRTRLCSWPLAAGAWQWRVKLPSAGDSNRGAAVWREGSCSAAPGAVVTIELPSGG